MASEWPNSKIGNMKLKVTFLFLCALLLASASASADAFDLTGKVVDDNKQAIEVGNVLLLDPADSSLIQGELFVDGEFLFTGLAPSTYLLRVTALGFEDYFRVVEGTDAAGQVDLGTLTLTAILLEGVEVVARQKIYERRGEDLVINVANTSLQSTGTAMEVLASSPKVLINNSGQVSIIGKGAALIYVDGQLIASNQILQNLSSNDIKEIQIIENPSAKYDASGNAVINIITKGRALQGFKIGLVQEVEKRTDWRAYFKADGYYKFSKLLVQASYGIRPFNRAGREYYARFFETNGDNIHVDNRLHYNHEALAHDYTVRTAYQLSSKSRIGIQYSGISTDAVKVGNNRNYLTANGENGFTILADIDGPYTQGSNILSGFFEQSLDTLGSNVSINAQYSDYNLDRVEAIDQDLLIDGVVSPINRRTTNDNNIAVTSVQADFVKVFPDGIRLEGGVKNAYITNISTLDFEAQDNENGQYRLLPEASSDYDYTENILAAYSQINVAKGKWKTQVGLRGEWTQSDGASSLDESEPLFSRSFFNLFPSASVTRTLSEKLRTNVSYSYRIQRPTFQDLNPFIFYVDSLVSLQGNSRLRPEFSHNLSASVTYKSITFQTDYTQFEDKINTLIEIPDFDDPAVFRFIRKNLERVRNFQASITFPLRMGPYSSYNVIGGRIESHEFLDRGVIVENALSGYYFYTNQSLQLPGDIKLECIIQYTSPRVDGIYRDTPVSAVSVAVSRKFFQNQLNVRVLGNDIFDEYKFRGTSDFGGIEMGYLSEGDWHFVKLSLNWSFGKLGTGALREKKISKDELRRIMRQ